MFGHAAKVKAQLVDAGFTFVKAIDEKEWQMYDGETLIGRNRSQGDLIRIKAIELGVW